MSVTRSFVYEVNNRFKSYTVNLSDNGIYIYRGDSVSSIKSWEYEDYGSYAEVRALAAQWMSRFPGLQAEQLIDEWKPRLVAPYIDYRWLDETFEEPPI